MTNSLNDAIQTKLKELVNKDSMELIDFIKVLDLVKSFQPNKPMYIIEFLRYGNRESHSYIGSVHASYSEAIKEAMEHVIDRDGKYCAEIYQFYPNVPYSVNLYRKYSKGDEI